MAKKIAPLRLLGLILFSTLALVVDPVAEAAPQVKPVYVELPELTLALNHEYQVVVQVTIRLPGPLAEKHVRDNVPLLNHALVLHLSGLDPYEITPESLETLADHYVLPANQALESKDAVKAAFFQKFMVQTK
jgi:flagellar basal body-associated protein FliL